MPDDPDHVPLEDVYEIDERTRKYGGFAEVFRATNKETGEAVALKRARDIPKAEDRLKSEIKIQSKLDHPHIMPILDYDPAFRWFTMPLAIGNLHELRPQLDEEDLAAFLPRLADALDLAHDQNLVHRDISPGNILAFPGSGPRRYRWVVADWGLVSRPYSITSIPLTEAHERLGTEGFAAPELRRNDASPTAAADVYSIGKVATWFLTNKWPYPGDDDLPEGRYQHWRGFIRHCIARDLTQRIESMSRLKDKLSSVMLLRDEPPADRAQTIVEEVIRGRQDRLTALGSLASDHINDLSLYIDHLAQVPTPYVRSWVTEAPELVARLATTMADHLLAGPWGDRDRQFVGTPLAFVHAVTQTLTQIDRLDLAEDLAEGFFAADAAWNYQPQRHRTLEWLASLDGLAGAAMARALSTRDTTLECFRQPSSWSCRSHLIADLLKI